MTSPLRSTPADITTSVFSSVVEDTLEVRPLTASLVAWRIQHVRRTSTSQGPTPHHTKVLKDVISTGITTASALRTWKKTRPDGGPVTINEPRWMFLSREQLEGMRCFYFNSEENQAIWTRSKDVSDWDIAGDSQLLADRELVAVDYSSHALYDVSGAFLPTALELGPHATALNDANYDLDAVAAHLQGRTDIVWDSQGFRSEFLAPGIVPPPARGRWDDSENNDDDNDYALEPSGPRNRILEGRWSPDVTTFRAIMSLASLLSAKTPPTGSAPPFAKLPDWYSVGLAVRTLDPFGLVSFRVGDDPLKNVPASVRSAVDAFLATLPPLPGRTLPTPTQQDPSTAPRKTAKTRSSR